MRIGVLTGGGDCPGLNAVIRAVTRAAISQGDQVFGFKDGFKGLIENRYITLDHDSVSGILIRGGTILGTTNRDNPIRYEQIINGQKVYSDMSPVIKKNYQQLALDALVVIGGDGTMRMANEVAEKTGIKVVGVPKTIDNDIVGTDLTFGFASAVDIATEALDRLHSTAESHHRVMLLEVMGRDAGWIALHAGIAGGADIILIPEISYSIQGILTTINDRIKRGKHFSLIIVAEGVKTPEGKAIIKSIIETDIELIKLGGISNWLARAIESEGNVECRATILGHLQRGGSPNSFDRVYCTQLGVKAVEMVKEGRFQEMVALKDGNITSVPLSVVKGVKLVDPASSLIKTARQIGISFGDI